MPDKIQFKDFQFNPQSAELSGPNGTRRLAEKPAAALIVLTEKPGEVISREELRSRLWSDDTFVDFDNNLHAAIKKLRDALGDSASNPSFIETLPRKGYRFIATVTPLEEPQPTPPPKTQTPPPQAQHNKIRKPPILSLVGVCLLILLSITWLAPSWERRADLPPGRLMLAVMPFENHSGDVENEYISDGLTEELIVHLSRLEPDRLGVISRMSAMTYKHSDQTVTQIGEQLGVHYLLEGSVKSDTSRMRVTVQLIQVHDQTNLWTERYTFPAEDLITIQDQVSLRVARTLAVKLLEGQNTVLARAQLSDTSAYRAYLKGRHQWNQFNARAYESAIQHFNRAAELAPDAAIVHAGLADAYNLQAFTDSSIQATAFANARKAAQTALSLDSACAEAHNALAFAQLYGERDFQAADNSFREALDLNPGYAMAWHWYAGLLSATGRHDEAVQALEKSLQLDPASLSLRSDLGWYLLFADRPEEAVNACLETLTQNPDYGWAESGLAAAYAYLELWKQALHHRRNRMQEAGYTADQLAKLNAAGPKQGWRASLHLQLNKALAAPPAEINALETAMLYAALDQPDNAFQWLEKAYDNPWMIFLRVDPRFDPLHDDPRFEAMAKRLQL